MNLQFSVLDQVFWKLKIISKLYLEMSFSHVEWGGMEEEEEVDRRRCYEEAERLLTAGGVRWRKRDRRAPTGRQRDLISRVDSLNSSVGLQVGRWRRVQGVFSPLSKHGPVWSSKTGKKKCDLLNTATDLYSIFFFLPFYSEFKKKTTFRANTYFERSSLNCFNLNCKYLFKIY